MGETKQLEFDFEQEKIVEHNEIQEEKENKKKTDECNNVHCKHKIILKSFKDEYLTYCSKCGDIIAIRRKPGTEIKVDEKTNA